MAAKTPLALVKEKFGDKNKLIEEVEKLVGEDLWVSRTNKDKGLKHVSNAKLLRLLATFTEVKSKFGTREKLIDAILELDKRGKDAGMRDRLSAWPVPRLFDTYRSAAKRNAPAPTKAKTGKPAPKGPAVKPKAKEATKPKAASKASLKKSSSKSKK